MRHRAWGVLVVVAGCAKGHPTAPSIEVSDVDEEAELAAPAEPGRTVRYKERTEIDFEGVDVQGELVKPSGALLMEVRATGAIAAPPPPRATESYAHVEAASWHHVADAPLSTFSTDADSASYTLVRSFLEAGTAPPPDAVRIEELLNAFDMAWPEPEGPHPLAVHTEVGPCPWAPEHALVQVGLQARRVTDATRPPLNLVFLVDVSGSMASADKLPLVRSTLLLLTEQLRPADRVGLVVYAGAAGVVLDPTPGDRKAEIRAAIAGLGAGGSTHGSAGIEAAYALAQQGFRKDAENRVILATDGDFNVGVTGEGALVRLIEEKRDSGVFLTVLGYGTGNLQDARMQDLAQHGNGVAAYVDDLREAERLFGPGAAGGFLVTVAKDAKIQVEWNPAEVGAYRLLGYETRALQDRDFADDRRDAGDLGAGHTVTALYEVARARRAGAAAEVPPLVYQGERALTARAGAGELALVRVRYKQPDGATSQELVRAVAGGVDTVAAASERFRLAAAIAAWGLRLRHDAVATPMPFGDIAALADGARGRDADGARAGLVGLMRLSATVDVVADRE